jgi:hypothetical protein
MFWPSKNIGYGIAALMTLMRLCVASLSYLAATRTWRLVAHCGRVDYRASHGFQDGNLE